MIEASANGSESTSRPESSDRNSTIIHELVRNVSGSTGLVGLATSTALPVALISAIVTVQYLNPTQFGEYALLMVYATFLTVLYNAGLLHGTFLWVYGISGEAGDDLEIEGMGRSGVKGQRRAMTTGLIMLLTIAAAGTLLMFIFKRPLAVLLLGNAHAANLVGWAAISGASGSVYRLTCNVFRFERRQVAFSLAMVIRPVSVVAASVGLLAAGYGLWGAVMGTVAPTMACAVVCMFATRNSYALAFSWTDVREIIIRGSAVMIPVCALFVLHNGDIYVVSHFVHGSSLGVYRLASRMGTLPSYFASAFIMTWSPLERSSLGVAAFKAQGRLQMRAGVATYYILVGLSMVVMFVLFARLFVLVAPRSYASAAKIVPLIALAFVAYGSYIVLLRTARPQRLIKWYTITAVLSAVTFVLCAAVLIPALGVAGAPISLTIGMSVGCAVILLINTRNPEPLPVQYKRIGAGFLVAGTVSAISLAGARAGQPIAPLTTVCCLLGYFPALVLTGAVPRSHVSAIRDILFSRSIQGQMRMTPAELPAAEREALERYQLGTLRGSRNAVEYARLVRALRRLGGIGHPSTDDVRIGLYLTSSEPEAIRDFQAAALIGEGVDAYELHHLDRLARAARRSRLAKKDRRQHSRMALRTRARRLGVAERAILVAALSAAGAHSSGRSNRRSNRRSDGKSNGLLNGANNGNPPPLALVRAVRRVRHSLGVGTAGATDLVLARALWHGDDTELDAHDRAELRRLKDASKLTTRFDPPVLDASTIEPVSDPVN